MTPLARIARPFSWLNTIIPRRTRLESASAVPTAADLGRVPVGQVQWVGNRVTLPRCLDVSCYQELVAATQQIYSAGELELVVDLRDVERIELTGLFALHCMVLTMRGKTAPDPDHGWRAIRRATEENLAAGRCEQVRLINASARISTHLQANHLDRCLVIHDQLLPSAY